MREYTRCMMWAYLISILIAEWLLAYVSIVQGLLAHSVIFITTILIYWRNWSKFTLQGSVVMLAFAYISLNRLVGVSILQEIFEMTMTLAFVNTPLLIGLMESLRCIGIDVTEYIFSARGHMRREFIIALTGIGFGLTEIVLIHVQAIPWHNLWSFMVSALSITVLTGFYEELLFRVVILQYLADLGSKWFALIYSSLLFAVMHISWHSFSDLIFVFLVGAFYGVVFLRTRSIVGISLSHGLTNIVLFMP